MQPAPTHDALDRIEAALSRIEMRATALVADARAADDLGDRHERLRRSVQGSLAALEALIAERGA